MVSVCMATYNGEKFIKEQVDSILCQLALEDELIISDDNSSDSTLDILSSYHDDRIKIFSFDRDKKGLDAVQCVTTNFENALSKATGDFIFLADQDDIWHKDKIEVALSYLKNNNIDYIVSDCNIINEKGEIIASSKYSPAGPAKFNKWKSLFGWTPFQGCCAAFSKKVLDYALPFPKGIQSHDRWIGYIAFFKFNAKLIFNENLIDYRRFDGNVSSATTGKSGRSTFYKVFTRLNYIRHLIPRLL